MEYREITNKKTGEKLIGFADEDFEKVNPIKYYHDTFVVQNMIMTDVSLDEIQGKSKITAEGKAKFLASTKLWQTLYQELLSAHIPENLKLLLTTKKKDEQEKLLKGVTINPEILASLLFYAYEKHGYLFSQYSSETSQKGLDTTKLPFAYEVTNENVKVYGKTNLSEGQLKQAHEHRKIVVAKFLEKDDNDWHCFFTTFKSLRGEEKWQDEGQPHFHYLSNYFGLSKEKVINELKSPKYKLGNLPHIKLVDYGNQPKKMN